MSPLFRGSRAVAFAAVCVTLATGGHALASGSPIPVWTVFAGFGGVLAVTLLLAGHERSLPTILGGLLGGQFVLHSLFAGATGPPLPAHHPITETGHDSGLSMTLAHVVAAVISAWWLRRGERAAWTLARRIADLTDRPFRAFAALLAEPEPAALGARTVLIPAVGETSTVGQILRHLVVRRGPPSLSALALG